MANQGLSFSDAGGGNRGYNGLWIGNVTAPFGDGSSLSSSLLRDAFYAAQKDDVLPTVVNVAAGVPILSGSLLDEDGVSAPPGIVVTVTQPNGTALDTSRSVYTDDLMIHLDAENNLSSFMIKNPAEGNWTVSIQISDGSEPTFQLIVSTTPTGTGDETEMEQTLESAFQGRFTDEQLDSFVEKHALGTRSCFWCKVAVWTIAVALTVILLAVTFVLSAESGVVVALALYAGVSAPVALTFIRTLITIVGTGVKGFVIAICKWTGTCAPINTDVNLAELSPQGGY